jgi:hypothetical protein
MGKSLTGPYYWDCTGRKKRSWTISLACEVCLGLETGHDEFWRLVLTRLAVERGRDTVAARRCPELYYTGLPRGRVTKLRRSYLIVHGDDTPIPD